MKSIDGEYSLNLKLRNKKIKGNNFKINFNSEQDVKIGGKKIKKYLEQQNKKNIIDHNPC